MGRRAVTVVALAALAMAAAGCTVMSPSASSPLVLVGTADDDVRVGQVPALVSPVVDPDAGFASEPGSVASSTPGNPASSASYVRVTSTSVQVGDRVTAGQEAVRFDDAALAAGVAVAQANLAVAESQLPVLDATIADTRATSSTLADKRTTIEDAIATLTGNQATLQQNLATARQGLATLKGAIKQLAAAQAAVAATVPTTPQEAAMVAAKKQALASQAAQANAQLAAVTGGISQLTSGLAQIETGLTQATSGLSTVKKAQTSVADARRQLTDVRAIAAVAVDASTVAVHLAEARRGLAAVTAPSDGIVVAVASAGDVLAVGAPAVTVLPDVTTLTTWVSPTQAASLCLGQAATLLGDWAPAATIPAKLTRMGVTAAFPPNQQPSDEVHLTRAIDVQFTASGSLPAGVPLEIHLTPCQQNR
jgi:X-X-X-Leu-X-X-Gly heptad repeat protein